ncbi:hypothetical protein V8B97DRAFT_1756812 [Scleroderma yunnanense]
MLSDQHLRQRFSSIEDNLLTAIADGTLNTFQNNWSSLFTDFSRATFQLDPATLTIVHTVASNVLAIVDCYSSMQKKQDELSGQLQDDWDRILGGISHIHMDNAHTKEPPSPLADYSSPTSSDGNPLPAFIAPAYAWLLQNLHHPYPSLEIKTTMATQSNCPLSSISAWFTNVRRRMGWTAICRDHFRNSRADTLNAAYRAFIKEDPARRLSSEVTQAFMTMKVNAECLYSSVLTRSTLASDLDSIVWDMASCSRSISGTGRVKQSEQGGMELASESRNDQVSNQPPPLKRRDSKSQHFYFDPDVNCHSSSAANLSSQNCGKIFNDTTRATLARNKRRLSTSNLSDVAQHEDSRRPIKRLRTLHHDEAAFTPSSGVCSSSDESTTDTLAHTPRVALRKRRLSNAGTPNRPCGSPAPRVYAVSDPLPKSTVNRPDLDAWFETSFSTLFDLPPPADSEEFDQSMPWEVEFFKDYCIPQEPVDICGFLFYRFHSLVAEGHVSSFTPFIPAVRCTKWHSSSNHP